MSRSSLWKYEEKRHWLSSNSLCSFQKASTIVQGMWRSWLSADCRRCLDPSSCSTERLYRHSRHRVFPLSYRLLAPALVVGGPLTAAGNVAQIQSEICEYWFPTLAWRDWRQVSSSWEVSKVHFIVSVFQILIVRCLKLELKFNVVTKTGACSS